MEKARSTRAWSVIFKTPFQIEPFGGEEPELLLNIQYIRFSFGVEEGKEGNPAIFLVAMRRSFCYTITCSVWGRRPVHALRYKKQAAPGRKFPCAPPADKGLVNHV